MHLHLSLPATYPHPVLAMFICPDCFADKGLKRRVVALRACEPLRRCESHPRKKGIALSMISPIVSELISNTYRRAEDDPWNGESTGESLMDVVYDLTGAHEDGVADALHNLIIDEEHVWPPDGEEPFFSNLYGYRRVHDINEEHSLRWEHFRREIIYNRRFFSEDAQQTLSDIFDGLHLLRDRAGKPVIYPLQPDEEPPAIFRARIANEHALQRQVIEDVAGQLGPPPPRLRTPGRMHPAGIRAFYGALDIQTCIAELRPTVGETVIGAKFTPVRPLLVLDTTRFDRRPKERNMFSKSYLKQLRLWTFMRRFMDEIAQPHLPGSEHLEYVPTQAVAEYLVYRHSFDYDGETDRTIDAIVFRSAQRPDGKNIAIFGDAAVVRREDDSGNPIDEEAGFHTINPGLRAVPGSVEEWRVNAVTHSTHSISYRLDDVDF